MTFRSFLLLASALTLSACFVPRDFIECEESTNCSLAAGGQCVANPGTGHQFCAYPDASCDGGMRWSDYDVEASISGACVAPDVAAVVNNQSAESVLGQATFNTATRNFGGSNGAPTDKSLAFPSGLASDGSALWVVDAGEGRALRWTPIPTTSNLAAAGLIGKGTFTDSSAPGPSTASTIAGTCCGPRVAISGSKLLVSDSDRNRVMIWSTLPMTAGQPANLVLGQPSLVGTSLPPPGTAANQLSNPSDVWTDGARVIVADTGNSRVLIWNSFPTTNGASADVVLGAPVFGPPPALPPPPTARNLKAPRGIHVDSGKLYVADDYGRVLVWNAIPTVNGTPADLVIGKPDFTTSVAGPAGANLDGPEDIATAGGALFVADTLNDRVLVFDPIPNVSGAAAAYALGQVSAAATPTLNAPPSQSSLDDPAALLVVGASLYVSDRSNHRVLRFGLNL